MATLLFLVQFACSGTSVSSSRSTISKPGDETEELDGYLSETSQVISSRRGGIISIGDAELEIFENSVDSNIEDLKVTLRRSKGDVSEAVTSNDNGVTINSTAGDTIYVDIVDANTLTAINEDSVTNPFAFRQIIHRPEDPQKLWLDLVAYPNTAAQG